MSFEKLALIIAILSAVLIASLRRPVFVLLFYLALIFIRPQDDRPNLAEMRLPYVATLVLMAFYAWRAMSVGAWIPPSRLVTPFLMFVACMTISAVTGVSWERSFDPLVTFMIVCVSVFLVLGLVEDETELQWVFWLIVACGIAFVYYAVLKGSDCIETQDGLGCGRRNFAKINHNFGQPNYLGLSMAVMFNFAFGLFLTYRRVVVRIGLGVIMILFVWVLMMTGSRGAVLALGASIVFYWLTSEYRLRGFLVVVTLAISAWYFAPPEFVARIGTLSDLESDQSAMSRLDLWTIGFDLIRSHPLLGVGIGNFEKFAPNSPHNAYIQIASELGLPALVIWIWLMSRALREVLWVRNACRMDGAPSFLGNAAHVTAGSLIAILVQSMTTGLAHREFVYIVVAVGGVLVMLYEHAGLAAVVQEWPEALPSDADSGEARTLQPLGEHRVP
jgi:O-antigen ligase